jgi:hypothetical protein
MNAFLHHFCGLIINWSCKASFYEFITNFSARVLIIKLLLHDDPRVNIKYIKTVVYKIPKHTKEYLICIKRQSQFRSENIWVNLN